MRRFSLKFPQKSLEEEFQSSKAQHNIFGFHVILTFNIILLIILGVIALISGTFLQFFFTLISFLLILLQLPLMKLSIIRRKFFEIVLIFLVLYPYFTGLYFTLDSLRNPTEALTAGFVFNMYLSFPIRVKISWYFKLIIHVPAYLFVEVMYYKKNEDITFSFCAMLAILILNVIFDFYQDKMERKAFLLEYYLKKNNEVFQHLFTNIIPEEILIWKKKGLDFANQPALDLFHAKDKEELQPILLKSIEIISEDTPEHPVKASGSHTYDLFKLGEEKSMSFEEKIKHILETEGKNSCDFSTFTAKIKIASIKNIKKCVNISLLGEENFALEGKNKEFDIKMRKFFWDSEEAVLILLNAVGERNLKSRLEFVNSYLNYLLANLSHEIYTPLNGLLGMLEASINELTENFMVREQLKIVKNSADFLLSITQDLFDFYNIRRGRLVLHINRISLYIYLKELFTGFSNCFPKESFFMHEYEKDLILCSDPLKLKQILVGIINHVLKNLINAKIHVSYMTSLDKENIIIEIKATGVPINPLNNSENVFENANPVKISRHLSYERRRVSQQQNFISDLGKFDGNSLEMTLIKYLSLSLAPDIDIPFQKKVSKIVNNNGLCEYYYQLYLTNIQENRVALIEDTSNDHISFQAEYKINEFPEKMNKNIEDSPCFYKIITKSKQNINIDKNNSAIPRVNDASSQELEVSEEKKLMENSLNTNIEKYLSSQRVSISQKMKPFNNLIQHFPLNSLENEEKMLISPVKTSIKRENLLILNVDDNAINLMVISNYCKISGFRVIEAFNGVEAVEKTRNLHLNENKCFDIVFMDCDMPLMNGFQACEQILSFYCEKQLEEPPVVAVTANDTNEDRERAENCGMKELVKKPLSKNKFDQLIKFWTHSNR